LLPFPSPASAQSDLSRSPLISQPLHTLYKVAFILFRYDAGLYADRGVCRLPLVSLREGQGEPLVDSPLNRVPHALHTQPHLMTEHNRFSSIPSKLTRTLKPTTINIFTHSLTHSHSLPPSLPPSITPSLTHSALAFSFCHGRLQLTHSLVRSIQGWDGRGGHVNHQLPTIHVSR
jgi:hypothetical protein